MCVISSLEFLITLHFISKYVRRISALNVSLLFGFLVILKQINRNVLPLSGKPVLIACVSNYTHIYKSTKISPHSRISGDASDLIYQQIKAQIYCLHYKKKKNYADIYAYSVAVSLRDGGSVHRPFS